MSQSPDRDSQRKGVSTSNERARALAAVLRDQKRRTERGPVPAPSARNQRARVLTFVVSLGLAFYVWFGSPSWAQPYVPPAPTPVEVEAGLRMAIYLQIQRIEVFREENGRLPLSLDEAGNRLPGVRYEQITGDVYRLRGRTDDLRITYISAQSPHEFLGDAYRIVLPEPGRGS